MATVVPAIRETAGILAYPGEFHWGAVIAGAISAAAVSFFLLTLGSGIGLALASPVDVGGNTSFLTLGAIYFLASQAFGFAVGGYLVGRLIGPEIENTEEEEFRAAAHGFAMWSLGVTAGLLLVWFSSLVAGSAIAGTATRPNASGYYTDVMFRPAPYSPAIAADKAEANGILVSNAGRAGHLSADDSSRLAEMVAHDAGMPVAAAQMRINQVVVQMRQDTDSARKAASAISLWTAFALLFGAMVAVAAAISSRWLDDRVTFSFAPRRR